MKPNFKFQTMVKYLYILPLMIFLVACGSNNSQKNTQQQPQKTVVTPKKTKTTSSYPTTVSIYRYGNFPISKAKKLESKLSEIFPNVVLIDKTLPLPAEYYNKERNRYSAKGLLVDLGKRKKGDAVIGLTDYVIFQKNNLSPTYGIMGLSTLGTYTSVISSKIPKGGAQTDDNFVKLALHELGHGYGLPHCPTQNCYMVDAEHKMKLTQTTGFCPSCLDKLQKKGWKLQ